MYETPAHDLWSLADGVMTLLREGGRSPENLDSALKTFNRVIAEAQDGSDALIGALSVANCVYAITGVIEKSNEYILASGLIDLSQTAVQ